MKLSFELFTNELFEKKNHFRFRSVFRNLGQAFAKKWGGVGRYMPSLPPLFLRPLIPIFHDNLYSY